MRGRTDLGGGRDGYVGSPEGPGPRPVEGLRSALLEGGVVPGLAAVRGHVDAHDAAPAPAPCVPLRYIALGRVSSQQQAS
eukprot:9462650-Pyramimonas_sp.AAC.1